MIDYDDADSYHMGTIDFDSYRKSKFKGKEGEINWLVENFREECS